MAGKAQTTLGNIFLALGLFTLLLMGAFNLFLGHVVSNDVELSETINTAAYTAQFDRVNANLSQTADIMNDNKTKIPFVSATFDFFATGIDSVKAAWISVDIMTDYMTLIQTNSPLSFIIPKSIWGIVITILSILLILVVLGALWRYQLT